MSYGLGSVSGLINLRYNGGAEVRRATADVGGLERVLGAAGISAGKLGKMATLGIGGALVAGLAIATKTAAEFEHQLAQINAVSGATPKQMDALRAKALQLGRDTAFSASESAKAMEELVKAGISIPDTLNGAADAVVALAAAGGIDMPEAATIASNAMNQFGLSAKDLTGVVDDIAGAANASAIDVTDLGHSMQQVGAVAHLAGMTFKDTATAIALMGNAGIKGSDAGTSLKTMLMNLQPDTLKQSELMKDLGIITEDGSNKFFDAAGNVKSFAQISGVLAEALDGQTTQQKLYNLQVMFGSDAIRAAAIAADAGADGVHKMNKEMSKMTAADVAAKRMDNLAGSMEQLGGSVETGLLVIGSPIVKMLRGVVDAMTDGVNATVQWVQEIGGKMTPGFKDLGAAVMNILSLFLDTIDAVENLTDGGDGLGGMLDAVIGLFNLVAGILADVTGLLKDQGDLVLIVGGAWLLLANGGITAVIARLGWFAAYAVIRALDGLMALQAGAARTAGSMGALATGIGRAVATVGAVAVLLGAVQAWQGYRRAVAEVNDTVEANTRAIKSGNLQAILEQKDAIDGLKSKYESLVLPDSLNGAPRVFSAIKESAGAVLTLDWDKWGRMRNISEGMDQLSKAAEENDAALQKYVYNVLGLAQDLGDMDVSQIQELLAGFNKGDSGALDEMATKLKQYQSALKEVGYTLDDVNKARFDIDPSGYAAILGALKSARTDYGRTEYAQESLTEAVANFTDETMSAADAAGALHDALDQLIGVELDSDEAAIRWRDSLRSLKDQIGKTNGAINGGTENADKNREAIIGSTRAMMDRAQADAKAGVSIGTIVKRFKAQRQALIDTAVSAGANRKQVQALLKLYNLTPKAVRTMMQAVNADSESVKVQKLIDKYHLTPDTVKTVVAAAGATTAAQQVQALRDYIDSLHDKTVNVSTTFTKSFYEHHYSDRRIADALGYHGGFTNATLDSLLGLESYHSGGLRNLPAGIYNGRRVMFAEPGTGGEAFIPLGESKRRRSEMLLSTVASMFGGAFVKFAEGGFLDVADAVASSGPLAGKGSDVTVRVPVTSASQPSPAGNRLRMLDGKIGFDESGNAYIRGLVEEVMDDTLHFDSVVGRMH